jgi:hypothetical protein
MPLPALAHSASVARREDIRTGDHSKDGSTKDTACSHLCNINSGLILHLPVALANKNLQRVEDDGCSGIVLGVAEHHQLKASVGCSACGFASYMCKVNLGGHSRTAVPGGDA